MKQDPGFEEAQEGIGCKGYHVRGFWTSNTKSLSLHEIFGGYTLQKLYYLNEESLIGWFCKNVKRGICSQGGGSR